jgi:hypothetical protein
MSGASTDDKGSVVVLGTFTFGTSSIYVYVEDVGYALCPVPTFSLRERERHQSICGYKRVEPYACWRRKSWP